MHAMMKYHPFEPSILPLTPGRFSEELTKKPIEEKPVLEICTRCPIMMVGLEKYRIVHKPCGLHGAMDNFFKKGGRVWV